MLKLFGMLFLVRAAHGLSWVCNYRCLNGPTSTSVLYKEDNVAEVKWLDKIEYCRAKGDTNVYVDAGQGKCEYSRDVCIWSDETCLVNPNRKNDAYSECRDLLRENVLVDGLDNGRG